MAVMPTFLERLRDMWEDATLGGDLAATAFVLLALVIGLGLLVAYNGLARAAWRLWLGL